MAVLKNLLLAASLFVPLTLAVPMVERRNIFTHTQTEYVVVTIEETTTVWVSPDQATAAPPPPAETVNSAPTSVAAAFHENPTAPAPSTFATSTSTSSANAPPVAVQTTTTPPPAAAPAPAATSPPAPAAAPSSAAPAPAPAPIDVQPKDIAASASANCEGSGSACLGDVTHWDGGLGACGWTVDTESELAIALPHGFMGTQSNGNPYCGRKVTLVNPTSGTTVEATVGDKCMGCQDRAIDCTNKLFQAITDGKGDGRLSGIQWYFS